MSENEKSADDSRLGSSHCSTFRAGDVVKHHPTGETWVLGCDERNGDVCPCGWPETMAKSADCELVTAASDDERLAMLEQCSKLAWPDVRGSWSREQLRLMNT